jgi:hypothetical protein
MERAPVGVVGHVYSRSVPGIRQGASDQRPENEGRGLVAGAGGRRDRRQGRADHSDGYELPHGLHSFSALRFQACNRTPERRLNGVANPSDGAQLLISVLKESR